MLKERGMEYRWLLWKSLNGLIGLLRITMLLVMEVKHSKWELDIKLVGQTGLLQITTYEDVLTPAYQNMERQPSVI